MIRNDIVLAMLKLARTGSSRITGAANGSVVPRFHRQNGHRRQDLSRRIEEFTAAFAACHGQTEAEFVESGRALRALYSTAETLARQVSERLAAMRDALGESRLGGPDGIAAHAMRDIQSGFEEASRELAMLQSVTGQLRRFRAQGEGIRRVGKFAGLSVFLFAVESARTPECQELFGSFVNELRAVGERISKVAETIEGSARHTEQAQELEWKAMSASHAKLSELAQKFGATASATATAAQALLDDSLNALKAADTHMRQITKEAGEAVFYLQFGDIVRQKTEHIAAALKESASQLDAAGSETAFRTQASLVDHTLAIQVGQLELIRSEVQAAQQKLEAAFENLGKEADELKAMLRGWHHEPAASQSTHDAVTAFKADLSRMEALHQDGQELRRAALRAAQSVSTASSQLAVHVEQVKSINMDVHLQALNAIVKAATLGESGLPLSVLSVHVDWLYRESDAAVTEVVSTLKSILEITSQDTAAGTRAEGQPDALALNAAVYRIVSAYDDFRETSGAADELVARQQAALANGRASLGFLGRLLPAIEQQIQELAAVRQALAPWVDKQLLAGAQAESLSERYTMHSEREIHSQLQQAAAGPVSAPMAPADDDNLLFFDAPPAPRAEPKVTQPETSAAPSGESPRSSSETPTPAPVLGDNVELF
jgi:hypothetical protein